MSFMILGLSKNIRRQERPHPIDSTQIHRLDTWQPNIMKSQPGAVSNFYLPWEFVGKHAHAIIPEVDLSVNKPTTHFH